MSAPVAQALLAAAAPGAWCRDLARVAAGVGSVESGLRAACAAAFGPPSLVDQPLLGATLAELTRDPAAPLDQATGGRDPGPVPGWPDEDLPPSRPPARRRPGDAPRVASPPPGRRPRRTTAGPPVELDPPGRLQAGPAGGGASLAPRAAARPGPAGPPAGAHPTVWPGHARRQPGAGAAGTAGPVPDAVVGAAADAPVERLLARVAARLGVPDPSRLAGVAGGVPAPGPAAPAALLDPGAPAAAPTAGGPPRRRPAGRAGEPAHRPRSSWPAGGGEPAGAAPAALAGEAVDTTQGPAAGPDAAAPPARWSAPAPDHPGAAADLGRRPGERPARAVPDHLAGSGPEPDPPGPAAAAAGMGGVSDDELEQAMRRILEDAARRHGIEV